MRLNKKLSLIGLLAIFIGGAAIAGIGEEIEWYDSTCFRVGPAKFCKPSTNWDTQKTRDTNAKYKFVLSRSGANPICWLRFDDGVKKQTAHAYAESLTTRLRQRGLVDLNIRKDVIDGRNVAFISGEQADGKLKYLIGAWRNQDIGINLECSAEKKDFATYEPQLNSFIRSGRIVSEHAY